MGKIMAERGSLTAGQGESKWYRDEEFSWLEMEELRAEPFRIAEATPANERGAGERERSEGTGDTAKVTRELYGEEGSLQGAVSAARGWPRQWQWRAEGAPNDRDGMRKEYKRRRREALRGR